MPCPLTIVIPYYKKRFLRQSLDSLAKQTCRDFEVFIGDDASPEDPAEIIKEFAGPLKIKCTKFENNLGRTSLSRQWDRCVLATESEWVWMFSDDDTADPDCVESFFRELKEPGRFDLYRFRKGMMDDDGRELAHCIQVPLQESAAELVLSRFDKHRSTTVPEHVFSRRAFEREGGFVDFPLAWCADDASWAAFAKVTGARTIGGGRVVWRIGQFNLSSRNSNVPLKLDAWRQYFEWLQKNFPDPDFQTKLKSASRQWLPLGFSWMAKTIPLPALWRFWLFYNRFSGRREWRLLLRMLKANAAGFH